MFIIIIGSGRLGSRLAVNLSGQGHDVVVIANEPDLKRLGKDFDGVAISGNPVDEDVLKKAGIEKAQAVVAVTANDNINVMTTQIAKEIFNVPLVLARISEPEREGFYKQLGLNTVCPTNEGINQIIKFLQKEEYAAFTGLLDSRVIGIKPTHELIGSAVKNLKLDSGLLFKGLIRKEQLLMPEPNLVIEEADLLVLLRK